MIGLLIVDDEEGVRRSLRKALEKDGYRIYLAEDGKRAVHLVQEHRDEIEVVISDFRMPGMDGLETLTAVEKVNPEITRIILTGYATMEKAIESVNVGIDGFLTKPFENLELRAKVRECSVRKRLKQFVSERVLAEMVKNGTSMAPKSQKVSILFTDIRGFSRLSEKMSPQDVSRLLSAHYFSPLDDIIHDFDGTLDKHIGDGIMGIFGAPVAYGDDALRAVCSAIRMRDEMIRMNVDPSRKGVRLSIGIGISTGEAMVGIFGSNRKKEYTVYGTTVNLASRLEKLARPNEILICRETYRDVRDDVRADKLGPLDIKGMDGDMDVFSVQGRIENTH